ncbi:MAG: DUF1289 domain-containing protein [Alphaproteobacteria bacterium]|nr:DUF1289 domain-containing protein [Alphaproteobacteria bacterium]MBV9062936.1 DUF1289 domain-containing protein [Alphaproteobacteria bacterium]MBV9913726.1 DUF1289 domain-containing protein [Nevskiaceae bacterium]
MLQSPCIKVCTLDTLSGICIGCGRTLDEIARWSSMTDAERNTITGRLPERLGGIQREPAFSARGRE